MLSQIASRVPAPGRILTGGLFGAALTVLVGMTLVPRTYVSSSSVIFPIRSGSSALEGLSLTAMGNLAQPKGADFPLATFEAVLNSDRAAMSVGRELHVERLWDLQSDEELREFMSNALSAKVNNIDRSMNISSKVPGTPLVGSLSELTNRAKADQRDEAYRVAASRMVEALLRQMDSIANDMMLDQTRAQLQGVEQQLASAQAKYAELRDRLAKLQQHHGTPDVTSEVQLLVRGLADCRGQIDELGAEIAGSQSSLAEQAREFNWKLAHLDDLPAEDPLLQEARARQLEARREFLEASSRYGPENSAVLKAKQTLQQAERRVREEAAAARLAGTPEMQVLRAQLTGLERQRAAVRQVLATRQEQIRKLPVVAAELTTAAAELEQQAKVVATLRAGQTSARLDYMAHGVRWSVLDPPRVPVRKSSPRLLILLIAGFCLGCVVLAPGAWRELLRRLSEHLLVTDRSGGAPPPA